MNYSNNYENTNQNQKHPDKHLSLLENLSVNRHILFFLAGFLGLSIYMLIIVSIYSAFDASFDIKDVQTLAIVNFTSYTLIFITILACLFYESSIFKPIINQFKDSDSYKKGFTYGALLIIGSILINSIMISIGDLIGVEREINENENLVRDMIKTLPVLSFFSIVVLAPICEEFAYRVGLFGGLRKINRTLAYVLGACIFGLIHANFDAENYINELLNLPSYIFAGVFLCYAYEKTDSVTAVVIAHGINNFLSFIMVLTSKVE